MARQVQGSAPGVIRTFVPTAFDNHLDPDPIEVDLRQPTEAEKREAKRKARAAFEIDGKTGQAVKDEAGKIRIEMDTDAGAKGPNRRAFEKFIAAVRGYTGADGKPINTGLRLFEHGEGPIVDEVAAELDGLWEMGDEQKKSSGAPSDSSPAKTQASAGIATTAAVEDSQSNAAAV